MASSSMSSLVRGGQRMDNPGGQPPEAFPFPLISLPCLLPGPEVVRPFSPQETVLVGSGIILFDIFYWGELKPKIFKYKFKSSSCIAYYSGKCWSLIHTPSLQWVRTTQGAWETAYAYMLLRILKLKGTYEASSSTPLFPRKDKGPRGKMTQFKATQPAHEGVDTMCSNVSSERDNKTDTVELSWRHLNKIAHAKHLA